MHSGQKDSFFKQALMFENLYSDASDFWFTEYHYNALFKMSKKEWKAELAGIFPDENFIQSRLYASMAMWNGKLYFAPYSANEIAEYDPESKAFRKIPLAPPQKDNHMPWQYGKFFGSVAVEGKIYFIPAHYPGILCLDTESDALICYDEWIGQVEEIRASKWMYFVDYILVGHQLILPCMCADIVVIFDIVAQTFHVVRTEDTGYPCKYCGVCREGSFLYLLSADGTVSKRKLDAGIKEIQKFSLPVCHDEIEFYPMRQINNGLYLFPFHRNQGFKMDTRTGNVMPEDLLNDEKKFDGDNYSFLTGICSEEKLYSMTGRSRRFMEYTPDLGEVRSTQLFLAETDKNILERQRKKDFVNQASLGPVEESTAGSLKLMLGTLTEWDDLIKEGGCQNRKPERGNKIYQALI